MSDNPHDGKNVRTQDFGCWARIEPKVGQPGMFTLTLSVTDGPDTFAHFGLTNFNDPNEVVNLEDGDHPLPMAIARAANEMIRAALENEAGRWIEDNETAYLVQGQTGIQTWVVKAFADPVRAHDLIRTLDDWCRDVGVSRRDYQDPNGRRLIDPEGKVVKCEYDPYFRVDETGVVYTIVEVPLDMKESR